MKKFINIVLFILVIFACLATIIFLPNYDRFLSEKVFNVPKEEGKDDPVLFSDRNISKGDDIHPVFSVTNDNIQIMFNDSFISLLPEGYAVNSDAPAEIFEVILNENNFRLSDDGSKAAYMFTFNKINTLFYCDFTTGEITKIDEKVDSFAISPDGSFVVYATGYLYSNTLFVYKNGQSKYVSENVSAFYESTCNQIALKNQDGTCGIYSIDAELHRVLTDGVTSLCFPTADGKYNYTKQYDGFVLYFEKDGHICSFYAEINDDGTVTSGEMKNLSCDFEEAVPYQVFKTDSDVYKFYKNTGKLLKQSGDSDEEIAKNIKSVYLFDGESRFLIATGKEIRLLNTDGSYETVLTFKDRYKNCDDLIENKISVSTDDFETFYICMLDASSWIWKKSNPDSWLNRYSKYHYSMSEYCRTEEGFSLKDISFPSSDSLYSPIILNETVYIPVKSGQKTTVYCYDGNSFSASLEGNLKMMKNESGIYCAAFENEKVTIYNISESEE